MWINKDNDWSGIRKPLTLGDLTVCGELPPNTSGLFQSGVLISVFVSGKYETSRFSHESSGEHSSHILKEWDPPFDCVVFANNSPTFGIRKLTRKPNPQLQAQIDYHARRKYVQPGGAPMPKPGPKIITPNTVAPSGVRTLTCEDCGIFTKMWKRRCVKCADIAVKKDRKERIEILFRDISVKLKVLKEAVGE